MNPKVCVFLLLVGVSCVFAGKFKQQKIDEKCGTDEACHAAAKKCLGTKDKNHHHKDGEAPTDKLVAFNKCLDDNGQGALKINEADCVDDGPRGGGGRTGRSHHHKCKKEVLDLLTSLEESVAGPIRCCLSTALKSEKVNSDGSMNIEHFRLKMNERFTDQTIRDIYETSFTTCLPKGDNCNVYSFVECSINYCIDQVQAATTQ